ncbi:MAG TPA: ATP-dependent DNA helicase RecG [Candidatus Acidoferrales bacterium]|nr:ATP-dependent DNA helicase RecG [Candidatus Acidoferrales bacterium]
MSAAGAAHRQDAPAIDPLAMPVARAGLPGGPILGRLRRAGIVTVEDLLFHLPRRYEDVREMRTLRWIAAKHPADPVSARVTVLDVQVGQTFRRRVRVVTARLRDDDSGEATAVWYGRRYVERRLHAGDRIVITGRAAVKGLLPVPEFQGPEFGPDEAGSLHAGRIVPVYRLTVGVTNPSLRRLIRMALTRHAGSIADYLPAPVRERNGLVDLGEALEQAHFPEAFDRRDAALRRLAFDELLALQVGMISRDRQRRPETADRVLVSDGRYASAVAAVEGALARQPGGSDGGASPSQRRARLTPDQAAAVASIRADLASSRPMLRLLQGDVGSGKTAVAALALAFVADAGRQATLLAPTDLLARQHAGTLTGLLEPLGHEVTLLTGSLPAGERDRALSRIAAEEDAAPVIVGTHALIQESVRFRDLALVVIDEQHRFGVAQRDALAQKGRNPHVLLMTATPIPQTLARVFYADLDVSDLRMLPEGRVPVLTGIRRFGQLMGDDPSEPGRGTWQLVARELDAGRRAFVVVPLVDEDQATEAVAVEEAEAMVREALPEAARRTGLGDVRAGIGVVHGQMPARERDAAMEAFRRGDLGVLVGTTVLEVGVDVPEASVMVILNADRFGVAQLHQLRGRVGRGAWQSYCVLVSDAMDEVARARLEAVERTRDGFVLAEEDLRLRRAGDLLGVEQSGLPPLRIARLDEPADRDLSAAAREEALHAVTPDGSLDPELAALGRELATGWLARVGAGEALPEPGEAPADAPASGHRA